MKIIALTGPKGSGKDEAGAALMKAGYRPMAFAEPIKEAIETMFSLDPRIWHDRDLKEKTLDETGILPGLDVSPRLMAQTLGTEWGRELIDPDIWVKAVEARIQYEANEVGVNKFVITDLRFDNEIEWVQSMGGRVVEVIRPEHNWSTDHASEAGPDPELIDGAILNNASIEILHQRTLDLEDTL